MDFIEKEDKMDLRIITLKGVLFHKLADAVQLKLSDGLIVINKNYASTTEKLLACKAIIFDGEKRTKINISDGWLVMNKNKCDLFVNSCN